MTNFENELVKSLKDKLQNNHWDLSEDNSFVRMAKEVSKDVNYFIKDEDEEDTAVSIAYEMLKEINKKV